MSIGIQASSDKGLHVRRKGIGIEISLVRVSLLRTGRMGWIRMKSSGWRMIHPEKINHEYGHDFDVFDTFGKDA